MIKIFKIKLVILVMTFFVFGNNLYAEIKNSIIAKIGNEIITNFDIENKIKTNLYLSGEEINQQNVNKIKAVTLKSLINLKLKSNEVKKHTVSDVINFIKKSIKEGNQVFWVCPLIEESKKLDHQSAIEKYISLNKLFPNKVGLLHSKIDNFEKENILNKFLNKEYLVLVSTTIIEVGIDFPNANVIIIENSNKFGLSQLHQLRGRVGRGSKQATCILLFKSNLSVNAKKRINILKNSNDGFKISEEDMKLRGFGDILGFKQSGIKNFKLADPIHNEDLFILAEKEIKKIEEKNIDIKRYRPLLKLYDQADIINDIV